MDIKTMIGKTFNFNLMSNASFDEIEGEVSASDFGDDVFHIIDSEDNEYEIPFSAVVSFYETEEDTEEETEEETTEEEAPAEEEISPAKRAKYENRSVDEIPTKKKKGLFGGLLG